MAQIQAENVADFVADTLRDLGKPKFTDISSNRQNHTVMKHLVRQNAHVLESGVQIQFNVLVGQSNAFRTVSLGQSDQVNMVDGMVQAVAPWRHCQTSYMVIHQLMSMNREPARIVDFVKQQRLMAMISLTEGMETLFWSAPSATDNLTPYGLPYSITKNATKGFNGGALTGYANKFGLVNTTYPNWANWTAPYTAISRDDFIRQAREMAVKTDFLPPVDGIPTPNTGDEHGYYCNYATLQPLEEALESQNDSLGPDIASMDGHVHFRGVPVTYVPALDPDTTNPLYAINWGWFKTYKLRGEWMRETYIPYTPGSHNIASHFIDLTLQWVHKNPRSSGVISNGTTYPS